MRLIGLCVIALVFSSQSLGADDDAPISVMTREGDGSTTVRAVRIETPLRIDGARRKTTRAAPLIGEQSAKIRKEFGL